MEQGLQRSSLFKPVASADILLVEDDESDAELTVTALGEAGFGERVTHVNDGEEALEYIESSALFTDRAKAPLPKLIMLDLNLRRVGGLQVLRRLKEDERTRGIPIIVLTSSKRTIEMIESYRLGVNSYVIKPTDGRKFAEVVARISQYWLEINEPPPC